MDYQKNAGVSIVTYHYKLEPGDGTMYRFSISFFPEESMQAYVLNSGVGNSPEDYVKVAIDMPGGTGIATLMIESLQDLGSVAPNGLVSNHLLGYAASHGLGNVNSYTLAAVLLACKVLSKHPESLDAAALNMLGAQLLLSGIAGVH